METLVRQRRPTSRSRQIKVRAPLSNNRHRLPVQHALRKVNRPPNHETRRRPAPTTQTKKQPVRRLDRDPNTAQTERWKKRLQLTRHQWMKQAGRTSVRLNHRQTHPSQQRLPASQLRNTKQRLLDNLPNPLPRQPVNLANSLQRRTAILQVPLANHRPRPIVKNAQQPLQRRITINPLRLTTRFAIERQSLTTQIGTRELNVSEQRPTVTLPELSPQPRLHRTPYHLPSVRRKPKPQRRVKPTNRTNKSIHPRRYHLVPTLNVIATIPVTKKPPINHPVHQRHVRRDHRTLSLRQRRHLHAIRSTTNTRHQKHPPPPIT